MTGRRFLLWLARTALVAIPLNVAFVGCSRQSEGERCDLAAAGDTDCNTGLVCVRCQDLRSGFVDRCCPPNAGDASDQDCQRADAPRTMGQCNPSTGGTNGFGGLGGRAGGGGGGRSGSATGGVSGESGESGAGGG
jgi:uncharacterized membrane protein YgcG